MKNQKLQRIGIIFLSLLFASATAYAGIFDNDEENWRRMFRDIKKINSRLVTLEKGKLQALENTQQNLFRQIDEIKSLIPNLQGSVEQSQAEVSGRLEATNRKLADIENQIKSDIVKSVNQQLSKINDQVTSQLGQQTIANEKFQANLATQFDQLKGHMAGDMDKIANLNKGSFQELVQSNNQSFGKVVEQLNAQKEVIKADLIPTIVQQNEKTSTQLLTGMSQSNKENKETLLAGLANIEAKNQKLVEVLQMSLKEGEATRGNVERLSLNVDATNNNVLKLKDALVLQIDSLSKVQQNLEQIKGDNALSGEKINKLISSSTALATHSNAMNQSLQSVGQSLQTIEGGLAGVEASNQKLTKLIDILKVMAAEQGKLTQIMAGQGDIKQAQSQVLNTQAQILKAQEEIKNAQRQSLKDQAETKKTLEELSRKANVNISRNDAIRKTLSNLEKSPSPTPPR
ncbi:MAG: hypothetical protein O3A78_08095 [Nitrospinae bacterium]|nr:hypothetical protein [Nitrospinota bacterium]MDA1109759.1 hypothetical protein [Nitrospinota bacterium]